MSNKLYEVLAVEKDLESVSKLVTDEALALFRSKPERFFGFFKDFKFFEEKKEEEAKAFQEEKTIDTTVDQKLEYVWKSLSKYFDCVAQKESTNQNAIGTVEIDGKIIMENVPATLLLGFETRLKKVREIYMAIPTLPPGMEWTEDTEKGSGIFKAKNPDVNHKTKKVIQHKIIVQATKEHPAQIERWNEDIPIGQSITTKWSGMISPAKKSEYLTRIDRLLYEVKKARQRANDTEVTNISVGNSIHDYIHG